MAVFPPSLDKHPPLETAVKSKNKVPWEWTMVDRGKDFPGSDFPHRSTLTLFQTLREGKTGTQVSWDAQLPWWMQITFLHLIGITSKGSDRSTGLRDGCRGSHHHQRHLVQKCLKLRISDYKCISSFISSLNPVQFVYLSQIRPDFINSTPTLLHSLLFPLPVSFLSVPQLAEFTSSP